MVLTKESIKNKMEEYYKRMLKSMPDGSGVLYLPNEQAASDLKDAADDMSYSYQRLSSESRGLSNRIGVMVTKTGISIA
jgi:hypothetical protein